MDVRIAPAKLADAAEILELRHMAFTPVALRYRDPELPPLLETLEQVAREPETHVVLKAVDDEGAIVGCVRAEEHDGVVHIGRLAVHPFRQGEGIGTRLTEAIIDGFPDAVSFELFTGHRSHAPLAIYRKLGFSVVREEPVDEHLTLLHLERPGPAARHA